MIYITAAQSDNGTTKLDQIMSEGNNDKELSANEFQEALVRLAAAYYIDSDSIEVALYDFLTELLPSGDTGI